MTAPGPRRGTRSSLALALAILALSLVRAAVRWIDHGYEYEGASIDSRRGKGTGNVHILYIGKVWHMFSLVQFYCIGIFNTFFCSFYELLMAFFWPKLSIEHSVTQG